MFDLVQDPGFQKNRKYSKIFFENCDLGDPFTGNSECIVDPAKRLCSVPDSLPYDSLPDEPQQFCAPVRFHQILQIFILKTV